MCQRLPDPELMRKSLGGAIIVPREPDPFIDLILDVDAAMVAVAREFAERGGDIRFAAQFVEMLSDAHARAHLLGQFGVDSRMMAESRAYSVMFAGNNPEADFIEGFRRALEERDPRYFRDDEWDADAITQRMRMYQGKIRGTQGWGLVDVAEPAAQFDWRLGAVEDSCADCPELAAVSPWFKETLYTTPGSGDTPCLYNCACTLVRLTDQMSQSGPIRRADPDAP